MTDKKIDPAGVQPTDPPPWRLLFWLLKAPDNQWRRGVTLLALIGLLLFSMLVALLVLAGWVGGVLGLGSLVALGVARRRRRRSGGV